jgi:hypothetical protein
MSQEGTQYGSAQDQGIKGTLLPKAAGEAGASTGFNARALMPINVDPDYADKSFVLQPGTVQGAKPTNPVVAYGYDKNDGVRQDAHTKLRQAVQEEPTMPRKPTGQPRGRPRKPAAETPQQPQVEGVVVRDLKDGALPTKRILFDFGPPFGSIEARFHTIFREAHLLVLGWDTRCLTANKFQPSVSKQPIEVEVGQERVRCRIMSLGLSFTDVETEMQYTVLPIDMEDLKARQQQQQQSEGGFSLGGL